MTTVIIVILLILEKKEMAYIYKNDFWMVLHSTTKVMYTNNIGARTCVCR